MPKPHTKTSTSGNNSNSYFSDVSRAIYRQQGLARKLKHIQQQNSSLQNQIKSKEDQIKDERTVIIYQMGELAKAVNNKLNAFEDFKIHRAMFLNEDTAHQSLKQLMSKFQNIQKQERMMLKVKQNMQKMFGAYSEHKLTIQKIMDESTSAHRQNQQKMKSLIQQKRTQLNNLQQQNTFIQDQIQRMKNQLQQFRDQDDQLNKKQKQLRKMIQNKEKQIKGQHQKLQQVSKWTQIVVDKRQRYQIQDGIKQKRRQLYQIQTNKNKIELALKQQTLKAKK